MQDKNKIIALLGQYLPSFQERYSLESVALFGSYARGEQRTDSDIDLLVKFSRPVGIEIVDLVMELEDILGQHVDVVTYDAVKNRLFHHIKDELAYV